jgi:hypothetical protein
MISNSYEIDRPKLVSFGILMNVVYGAQRNQTAIGPKSQMHVRPLSRVSFRLWALKQV